MLRGYNELRGSAAWVDCTNRGLIRMTGEDRARLLHALATNHIQQLQPGQGCYAFFLNAQGRILADANILCFDDALLVDTEPETRERLWNHLDQYIIADDVTLEDVTATAAATLSSISIEGPRSREAFGADGARLPETEGYWCEIGGGLIAARLSLTGGEGWRVFGPPASVEAFAAKSGLVQADEEAVRTVRLELGHPRYGEEISERFLVQETGQMRAMHFSKGCYLGQEIVERVRSRGQVHRHLMQVFIDGNEAPPAGAKLTTAPSVEGGDAKEVGEIVSAAYSPALGKVAAMAYLRTDAAKPGFEMVTQDHARRAVAAGPTT